MLCFVLPIPGPPQESTPPKPTPRDGGTLAIVLVLLVSLGALVAPIGWAARPHTSLPARRVPTAWGAVRLRLGEIETALARLHDPGAYQASRAASLRLASQRP